MGRNLQGGNKQKKFARKTTQPNQAQRARTRFSTCAEEVYAIVTRMCGNRMFECHGIDGRVRTGHIRGKFTFRHAKRQNLVAVGTWVLVGDRSWESSGSGEEKRNADLLHVYTAGDNTQLMKQKDQNWAELLAHNVTSIDKHVGDAEEEVHFTTDYDMERELFEADTTTIQATLCAKKPTAIAINTDEDDVTDDVVNIDDI